MLYKKTRMLNFCYGVGAGSEDHYSNLGSLVLSFCILPISVHIPVQLQFERCGVLLT